MTNHKLIYAQEVFHQVNPNKKQAMLLQQHILKTKDKVGKIKPRKGNGRAGDPRMSLAVEAKHNNPDMSYVSALISGGFVFPDIVDLK